MCRVYTHFEVMVFELKHEAGRGDVGTIQSDSQTLWEDFSCAAFRMFTQKR